MAAAHLSAAAGTGRQEPSGAHLPGSVLRGQRPVVSGSEAAGAGLRASSGTEWTRGLGASGLRPLWGPEKPGKRVEAAGSGDLPVVGPMLHTQTGFNVLFTSIAQTVHFQLWGRLGGKHFGADGRD